MVEQCLGPSELHLKKELNQLLKSRSLRDPSTCSTWRSPTCSPSVSASYKLTSGDTNNDNHAELNYSNHKTDVSPRKSDIGPKKAYLCNWTHHSRRSNEAGDKFDDSPDNGFNKASNVDCRGEACREVSYKVPPTRSSHTKSLVRRTIRKPQRPGSLKKHAARHSLGSKLPGLPSTSFGAVRSAEFSDETGHYDSDDLKQSKLELISKGDYISRSSSPFVTGSGCGNWSCSSKLFRSSKKEDSSHSYTPASTSSYNVFGEKNNASTVGSWDGISNDGDELDELDLTRSQGCGIPCYRPKRTMEMMGCGGRYSPTLSGSLRKKGSHLLCGGQKLHSKKNFSDSLKYSNNLPKSTLGLPLLTNGCDGASSSELGSNEFSTNYNGIDLEASSRLDVRRWSSCKSQEGLELAQFGESEFNVSDHRSLSQKYNPRSFEEIVGQNIVVQSLRNAVLRGRISPAFLFQGPHGTGKTSVARIFAAALNCRSTKHAKPCGVCVDCSDIFSRKGSNLKEVDAIDTKSIEKLKSLLKDSPAVFASFRCAVFIIDDCHLLSSKIWSAFIKYLEDPASQIIIIFITVDNVDLPRAFLSRCRKYLFPKIKEVDIVSRLSRLCELEKLDAELDALNLIASNSCGSLCDAETMLDQLSLLGKKITASLVYDLIGVVSDDKLLDLLEVAMSSDTAETVRMSRELMSAGVDPISLMSQLAALIMDIIAGTHRLTASESGESTRSSLTEAELGRLRQALNIVSEAEKQLHLSSKQSTWFTAALLQLGSANNLEPARSSRSSNRSSKITMSGSVPEAAKGCRDEKIPRSKLPNNGTSGSLGSSNIEKLIFNEYFDGGANRKTDEWYIRPENLSEIWRRCIERCHSKALRKLLCLYGKLDSVSKFEGDTFVASISFQNEDLASRAERFISNITNSVEMVLGNNVEIRISTKPVNNTKGKSKFLSSTEEHKNGPEIKKRKSEYGFASKDRSLRKDDRLIEEEHFQSRNNSAYMHEESYETGGVYDEQEISLRKSTKSNFDEQRVESAWLRATERNKVVPRNCTSHQNHNAAPPLVGVPTKQREEEELKNQMKALRVADAQASRDESTFGRAKHDISPSLLHYDRAASSLALDNLGYDSGPGCNGLLCCKPRKSCSDKHGGSCLKPQKKSLRLSLFGQCGKPKMPGDGTTSNR